MRLWRGVAMALAMAMALAGGPAARAEVLDTRPPADGADIRSIALVLVPAEDWPRVAARTQRLAAMNALTVAVAVPAAPADCAAALDGLLDLARDASEAAGAPPRAPVVLGLGGAAGLALALAAADPLGVKGVITETATAPPCAPALGPTAPVRWYQLGTRAAPVWGEGTGGSHRFDASADQPEPLIPAYLGLAGSDSSFAPAAGADLGTGLPLTLHTTELPGEAYAIFLSGDGGWAGFDQKVSDLLAAEGLPVVGISALKYLWTARTPEEIAADIVRIDAAARPALGRDRLVLAGFSMGANIMPFVAPHLPATLRQRLGGMVLMAPERTTGFEVAVSGWLGRSTGDADVTAALATLPGALPVLCLHGEGDDDSACNGAARPGLEVAALPGGHHMSGDHDLIAARIAGFLARRLD